jgi:hypothetical protein
MDTVSGARSGTLSNILVCCVGQGCAEGTPSPYTYSDTKLHVVFVFFAHFGEVGWVHELDDFE